VHATEFSVSAVRGGYLDGSPTNTTPLILFWQSYGNVEDRDHDISSGRSGNDDQDDPHEDCGRQEVRTVGKGLVVCRGPPPTWIVSRICQKFADTVAENSNSVVPRLLRLSG
jgi:hypothetical protein